MKNHVAGVLLWALAVGSAVAADESQSWSANAAVVSQYVARGLTQTEEKPALQAGVDWTTAAGWYAGAWGSNVSWFESGGAANALYTSSANLEVDLYTGIRGATGDASWDAGILHYSYPGSYGVLPTGVVRPDSTEVYASVGLGIVTLKGSYTVSEGMLGVANARGSWYAELNAEKSLGGGWKVLGHAGHQRFAGPGNDSFSYSDWKLGVSRDLLVEADAPWVLGVAVTGSTASDAGYRTLANSGKNIGAVHGVLSISRTF